MDNFAIVKSSVEFSYPENYWDKLKERLQKLTFKHFCKCAATIDPKSPKFVKTLLRCINSFYESCSPQLCLNHEQSDAEDEGYNAAYPIFQLVDLSCASLKFPGLLPARRLEMTKLRACELGADVILQALDGQIYSLETLWHLHSSFYSNILRRNRFYICQCKQKP